MPAIILGVYVFAGAAHEVSAIRFWEKPRKFTKAALMPILLAYYAVTAADVLAVAVIAIVFSWLGDILLIRKDEPKFFRLGLVAFLLSHIFYIVTLVLITRGLHVPALVASIAMALAAEFLLPRIIKPPKAMRAAVIVYGIVILAMSVCALQYMLSNVSPGSVLLFAGSIVFIFSDTLMTYLSFREKPKYFNAITMLPYIIAQGLIIFGLSGAL
ncbi:MAG: lysoplasmalogenase [Treponema sp.]|nr:lysoplasmalogenase [Treponema sp.]